MSGFQIAFFFSFLALTPAVFAGTPQGFDNCCICVADSNPKEDFKLQTRECNKWFDVKIKTVQCGFTHQSPIYIDPPKGMGSIEVPKIQCKKAFVWGTFHGEPDDSEVPFKISKYVAEQTGAQEVCYDGVSCLVFNNIEDVKKHAHQIAQCHPNTTFSILGNQNVGFARRNKFLEDVAMSSKAVVKVENGKETVTFAECSSTRAPCAFENPLIEVLNMKTKKTTYEPLEAQNDINTKFCTHQGKVVEQACCLTHEFLDDMDTETGRWAEPGKACVK